MERMPEMTRAYTYCAECGHANEAHSADQPRGIRKCRIASCPCGWATNDRDYNGHMHIRAGK